jgi:para-aminobenzoate synthetase component I
MFLMLGQPHHQPLAQEIAYLEPALYAARLRGQDHVTLFESVMRHEHLGRYSFLACNPTQILRVERGRAFLDGAPIVQNPLEFLDAALTEGWSLTLPGLPPFQGGYAGYVSYDFGWQLMGAKAAPQFQSLCPDLIFNRYDTVVSFDHMQERAWIVGQSLDEIAALDRLLRAGTAQAGRHDISGWTSNFTRPAYEAAVQRTVDYILAGDIFQANITQCFSAAVPSEFDSFAFYNVLRAKNPATFATYLDYDDVKIVSSSPERLVNSNGAKVQARPIKGTRRRDADPAQDAALVAQLMASRKDRAENVMIVDLLRNDLSRIAKPGSVKVPVLCGLESYANVHHLVSVVEAELRDGLSNIDLLKAVFPGGSITGAPKIRAMEIIAELEGQARGVYCGSIGYLGFNGTSDFNIAIRTALFADGKAFVQGGGGITARSEPAAEYDESLTKISRLMEAFAP